MIIDNFYNDIDKSHFYIGLISQVYRNKSVVQVENLTWFSHRKIKQETLTPNTINYFVIIDSSYGLFIGEVLQSKISSSDTVHESLTNRNIDNVYPELTINIVGLMNNEDHLFKLAGFSTVGIMDKVYIANNNIVEKYINSIEVTQNDENRLSSFAVFSSMEKQKVSLKPSTLFDRHLMVIGTTNSGKSTSSLSILDKLINDKKKVLIIDATGEYSNSFDSTEINKLKLGVDTVMSVGNLSISQWATLFETNDVTQPAVLAGAIKSLRYQKKNNQNTIYKKEGKLVTEVDRDMATLNSENIDFNLSLLPSQISEETNQTDTKNKTYKKQDWQYNSYQWLVQKVQHKLDNSSIITFFSNDSSKSDLLSAIDDFVFDKESSLYIDSSDIGTEDEIGGVIVDFISNYVINKKENKAFVMFIDEVHRYSKRTGTDYSYYTGLTTIAREGRKKGIFLFLTTQNPQDVSKVLLGQVGSLLIHRLTHYEELKSVQNYLDENTTNQINKLNQGEAVFSSINLLNNLHIKITKCVRQHNNKTPIL